MNGADAAALDRLLLARSVRRGHFVLASGRTSEFYVDARLTTMSAEGLMLIGRLGLAAFRDAFSVRKEAKAHGTARRVEGNFRADDAIVVVEDVITSGGSALKAIEAIREEGGQVLGILAVVDREEGGRAALEAAGHGVVALTTATRLGLK